MPNRYCRNCGNKLRDTDRFCPNCATPVQEAAHVPTPEADVEVPPPPQQRTEATDERDGAIKWAPLLLFLVVDRKSVV